MLASQTKLMNFQTPSKLVPISLASIQETAKTRWLKTAEINYILTNIPYLISLGFTVSPNVELHLPPSGSILLFPYQRAKREWKKDGYDWVKRKDTTHVREDVEKLRYCGQPIIYCTYATGTGMNDTPKTIHRRTYWLLSNPTHMLVHYLDEAQASKLPEALPDSLEKNEFLEALNLESQSSSVQDTWDTNNLFFNDFKNEQLSSVSILDKHRSSLFSFDEDLSFDLRSHAEVPDKSVVEQKMVPVSEYADLQLQIKELQGRMSSYEQMLSMAIRSPAKVPAPNPIQPAGIKPEFLQSLNIEIIDFSPEWDYTTGGAKVLVCINPSLEQYRPLIFPEALSFRFDTTDVPATFLQGSVLKCFAPPHKPAFVPFSLMYAGQVVATSKIGVTSKFFEYRPSRPEKKKKQKTVNFLRYKPESQMETDSREYKIRAIECLSSLEAKLHQTTEGNKEGTDLLTINGQVYTLATVKELSNEQLDLLTKVQFINLVNEMLGKLKGKFGSEETAKLVNQKDVHGCALIHYISALDYHELVETLKRHGAALDVKTEDECLTPLIISAARGNKKTLSKLLFFGAGDSTEETKSSPAKHRQMNPLKIAVERKHHNILEMLLRDMTLKDAISGEEKEYYTESSELKRRLERQTMPRVRDLTPEDEIAKSRKGIRRGMSMRPRAEVGLHELNNLVLKIQRNVREWLLRRHYKDIKQASKVLHSTLEKNLSKKTIDQKNAAIMIQRTVRAWLNIKNEISNE